MSGFEKYEQRGAYHWRELSRWRLKRFNAVLEARYGAVLDRLRAEPAGRGVDLGCGDGALAFLLASAGHRVVGLDAEQGALAWARRSVPAGRARARISWVRASALRVPLRDESCDWAVLGEILEHVERPEELLAGAARLLRPGGLLVVTTPRRIAGHPWDAAHHVREYDEAELRDLLGRGFEDVRVEGLVPMRLFRAYRLRKGWRTPVRVAVNLCAILGWNPFRRGARGSLGERYGQLIGVARRPRPAAPGTRPAGGRAAEPAPRGPDRASTGTGTAAG